MCVCVCACVCACFLHVSHQPPRTAQPQKGVNLGYVLRIRCTVYQDVSILCSWSCLSPQSPARVWFLGTTCWESYTAISNPTLPQDGCATYSPTKKKQAAHVGVAATTPGPGVHDGFAGAAAATPPFAPASTSLATTRPPGPVPARADRSIPLAPAFFLASPEATTRPPSDAGDAGVGTAEAAAAAVVASAAGGGDAGAAPPPLLRAWAYSWTAGMSDSLSTRRPMGPPTD